MSALRHRYLVCPACRRAVAKRDRRRRPERRLSPENGARLLKGSGRAPALFCTCGHVLVLMPGSAQ